MTGRLDIGAGVRIHDNWIIEQIRGRPERRVKITNPETLAWIRAFQPTQLPQNERRTGMDKLRELARQALACEPERRASVDKKIRESIVGPRKTIYGQPAILKSRNLIGLDVGPSRNTNARRAI